MAKKFESLKGKFLIAAPSLRDPNFAQTLILICEHDEKGAFGVVVNRKANFKAQPQIDSHSEEADVLRNHDIYLGGPVNSDHLIILYRCSRPKPGLSTIVSDLVLAKELHELSSNYCMNEQVRLYLGCAGWNQSQLEGEISLGAWKVLQTDTSMVFNSEPQFLWADILRGFGGNYKLIADMPDKSEWELN